ncbi:hypothetical protein FACS1894166_12290 [Bacilli bacterium]|nr:hypothetical protein FACS1894166_12290 [Bacilli bacterium]
MNTFKTYQGNGFTDLVHEIDAMENIFYYKNATNEQLLQEYGPILMANKEIKERIDYIKSTKIEKGNLFILSQATEFLQTETEDLEQKLERIATQYTPLVEVMKDRLVETPNMMMFIPSSTTEVSSESKQQHNCLMSHGYEGSINKNCILVFIRRKNAPSTSFVTMSLNRKDHYSDFLPSAKLSTVIEKRKNMSDFNLQEIKTNQIDGYGSNSCQIYGSRLSKEEHKELLELLSNFFEKNQIHPNNHDFQTLKETVKKEQKEKQK